MKQLPQQYIVKDNGIFPNSHLPVVHYKKILSLPLLGPGAAVKTLFATNDWSNNWKAGIYTYHHYHSVTHEAMAVIKGKTNLQIGGDDGIMVLLEKGDVLIIPAGVAHKNLGKENDVTCIGGYPHGNDYDMNYGRPMERPGTDNNIAAVPLPSTDPVFGKLKGVSQLWKINNLPADV